MIFNTSNWAGGRLLAARKKHDQDVHDTEQNTLKPTDAGTTDGSGHPVNTEESDTKKSS